MFLRNSAVNYWGLLEEVGKALTWGGLGSDLRLFALPISVCLTRNEDSLVCGYLDCVPWMEREITRDTGGRASARESDEREKKHWPFFFFLPRHCWHGRFLRGQGNNMNRQDRCLQYENRLFTCIPTWLFIVCVWSSASPPPANAVFWHVIPLVGVILLLKCKVKLESAMGTPSLSWMLQFWLCLNVKVLGGKISTILPGKFRCF